MEDRVVRAGECQGVLLILGFRAVRDHIGGGLDVWVETLIGWGLDVWVEAQQIKGEGKEKKSVRRVAKCCDCLSAAIGAR